MITSPTEVVGTVSDSHILSWTLAEAPLNGGAFTTIASGTSTVNDADLGLFDPTTLADGAYTLERERGGSPPGTPAATSAPRRSP